jgi:hypothetical protein
MARRQKGAIMLDSQVHSGPAIATAARTIGLGALTLALAYVALSIGRPLLILAFGQADDGAFLTPEVAGSIGSQVVGVFVALVFFVIAGSMLVMRAGLRAAATSPSVWTTLITDAVILGAAGFALLGGLGRVMLSVFASSLSDTGADVASQVAALHIANIVSGAAAVVGGAGLAVLLAGFATIARSAGIFGAPTSIVAWIGAAALLVGFVGFAFGPVQFVAPFVFLTVAVVALRRGRRAAEQARS